MIVNLILALLACLLFIAYNAVAIGLFGIPESLSNTYYLYENKKKGLGSLFTAMMIVVAGLLMPAWLNITEVASSWSSYLTFLPFFGAASIIFVGSAPAFKSTKMEGKVHTIAALVSAATSLLWDIVVCWPLMWIVPIWVAICGGAAHATHTQKSGLTYWLEMIAFGATFTTIISEICLHI